ncbi:hypothetical protein DPMN_105278 [Dreissena polymorpha]|uniref:CCHC-type domain-containing protein n=1 Tax=Dreissena polymorpha TaxID=45954 RepID=A0A9D4HEI8_DREPO|nr:hypothetical protein DPMN_105278 [Dreissena polymorpha]
MRKFYSSQQLENEPVVKYAMRLEEIFDQAVQLKAVRRTDTDILKKVLHAGLTRDLKHMSIYQCDKIENYDEFKRELRKIETELKGPVKEQKSCKAAVNITPEANNDLSEMKTLLLQLSERIANLEKEKGNTRNTNHSRYPVGRRGAYMGRISSGRGTYMPSRPTAGTSFQSTCYMCNQKGHTIRTCPLNNDSDVICFKCNQKGHRQLNCPKV